MEGVNEVTIIGNVGSVGSLNVVGNNKSVLNIKIASSSSHYNQDKEKKTETSWHNVVMWNNLAELGSKHIIKGCLIYVQGKINYRKNPQGIVTTEIAVKSFRVLSKKSDEINDSDIDDFEKKLFEQ